MEQTVFIRSFVKNKDKKSLLEQPKCVFIRLDILQVYGLNSVGLFSSSITFADRLLRFIFHLSAHILESNFWFFLNVFFGIFLRNWYIQIYCTTNSFTTTLYFKFRIFFRTSVIRGKNGKKVWNYARRSKNTLKTIIREWKNTLWSLARLAALCNG